MRNSTWRALRWTSSRSPWAAMPRKAWRRSRREAAPRAARTSSADHSRWGACPKHGGAASRRARSADGYRACRGHSRPGAGRLGVETPARQERDPPHTYGSVRPGPGARRVAAAWATSGMRSPPEAGPGARAGTVPGRGRSWQAECCWGGGDRGRRDPGGLGGAEVPMVQAPGGRPRRAPRRGGRGAAVMACGSGFAGDGAPSGAVGERAAFSGVVAQAVRSTSTVARALTVWSRQPPDASQFRESCSIYGRFSRWRGPDPATSGTRGRRW